MAEKLFRGGCLCGAVRYEANGAPDFSGHCYCTDCRKVSGSGFVGFMSYKSSAVRFSGVATRQYRCTSHRGTDAVRNSCPHCASLVFGGVLGTDATHTIYAGSLDDASLFRPQIAIFNRSRPDWAKLPDNVTIFETLPD